jgi:hypothetical protein
MGLKLKKGLESFLKKKLKQIITHLLPMFSTLFLYFLCSKNIYNLPIYASNDTKKIQFC